MKWDRFLETQLDTLHLPALMLTQQSFIAKEYEMMWGEIKGWSLGFAVEPTDHGTGYSHGGDNGGFQAGCMFYRTPDSGYVLSLTAITLVHSMLIFAHFLVK